MCFERVIKMISASKSPLLLLGGGASSVVDGVKEFVKITGMPVVSTLMGIGTFPSKDELYLGMIGINGTYPANTALNNADLILALGVSFSDRSTCKKEDFAPNAKIISVNTKKSVSGFELEICADSNMFLEGFIPKIQRDLDYSIWRQKVSLLKQEVVSKIQNSECLHSSCVLETIYEYTKNKQQKNWKNPVFLFLFNSFLQIH